MDSDAPLTDIPCPLELCGERNEQLVLSLTVNVRGAIQMDLTNLPKRYRAIIADDDPMFRYALRAIVNETCEVIAEAENGLAAIQAARRCIPTWYSWTSRCLPNNRAASTALVPCQGPT